MRKLFCAHSCDLSHMATDGHVKLIGKRRSGNYKDGEVRGPSSQHSPSAPGRLAERRKEWRYDPKPRTAPDYTRIL